MINFQYIKHLNLDEILPDEEKVKFINDLEIITEQDDDFSVKVVTKKNKVKKFTKIETLKINKFLEKKFS
jgi:hypothetical protein